MEKPANTSLNIHPIIKNRWSPRAFLDKPVGEDKLQRIFEAARWAPSSFNDQPWRFIVGIKGDDTWEKLYSCLVEFNQKWAVNAPVLLLATGNKMSSKGGPNQVYQYDVGQSMAYITFQVEAEGLSAHQIGGFSKEKAVDLFGIPEDHIPIAMMTIGHQAPPDILEPSFAEMEKEPRTRKSAGSLVFSGQFGEAFRFEQ